MLSKYHCWGVLSRASTHPHQPVALGPLFFLESPTPPQWLPFLTDASRLATLEWENQGSMMQAGHGPVEGLDYGLSSSPCSRGLSYSPCWYIYGCITPSPLNFPPHSSISGHPGSFGHQGTLSSMAHPERASLMQAVGQ